MTFLRKFVFKRLAAGGGKGKNRCAAAEIKDNTLVPATVVAVGIALQLLVHIDAVPAAFPAALQPQGKVHILRSGQRQLHSKAPLFHRGQNGHTEFMTACLRGHGRDPVMLPAPHHIRQGQLLPTNRHKGSNQRQVLAAPNLDQTLVLHGQVGKILDSGGQLIDFRQRDHLIAGRIIAFHKTPQQYIDGKPSVSEFQYTATKKVVNLFPQKAKKVQKNPRILLDNFWDIVYNGCS